MVLKAKGSEHSYCDYCSALLAAVADNGSDHTLRITATVKTKEQKPRYVNLRNYTIAARFAGWKLASQFTSNDKGKMLPFEIMLTNGKDDFIMSGFVLKELSLTNIVRSEPEEETATGK